MTLLLGNCLNKLKELETETVDLIYLDPPFFTQKSHSLVNREGTKEYNFEDTWDSLAAYKQFLKDCLIECYRLLKTTGNLFLHCDKTASHHLRLLLDEVFGPQSFQSEIIWAYRRWSNSKKGLLNAHQTIFFYSKSEDFQFNTLYTDYSPSTNIDQILQERVRNEEGKTTYKRTEDGTISTGREKKGVPLSDVWNIPYLNPKASERTGYPTQKPVLLLEQIIKIGSSEGDLVLDPFCGSGTTLVAASLHNRHYLGIDKSPDAIALAETRLASLVKTRSALLEKGEESYLEKTERETALLKSVGAVPVQRNKGIDGLVWLTGLDLPVAVKIQKTEETLSEAKSKLVNACRTKNCAFMVLIKTNLQEEYTLFELADSTGQRDLLVITAYDLLIHEWAAQRDCKAVAG